MPDKVLATIGSGPMLPVLQIALRSFATFAEFHGYDIVVGVGESDGRPPAWGKILLLRRLLERYKIVVWFDSDMVIVDPAVDLPSLEASDYVGFVEHHYPTERGVIPNTGLWVLQQGDRADQFLAAVWASEEWIHHRWWEQAAVMDLLGYQPDGLPTGPVRDSEWRDGVAKLPPEWNVLYPWPWPDHVRAFHFAGMPNRERQLIMRVETERALSMANSGRYVVGRTRFRVERAVRQRILHRNSRT